MDHDNFYNSDRASYERLSHIYVVVCFEMDIKEHGAVTRVNAEEHKALAPGICIDTEKCLGKEY